MFPSNFLWAATRVTHRRSVTGDVTRFVTGESVRFFLGHKNNKVTILLSSAQVTTAYTKETSLIYYASMICALFILTKAILAYIARFNRGVVMSKKVFEKNLEKLDLDAVNTYSESVNSSIPTSNEGE